MSLSCGCNYYNADLEKLTEPVARNQYRCDECNKTIKIGEQYARFERLYDGMWWTDKVCEKCHDLGSSMAELGFCWIMGELKELHREYIEEYNPPKLRAKIIGR